MSMPQVHIVAYCSDLGYGAARGTEMLSLMLGVGIVSRLVWNFVNLAIAFLLWRGAKPERPRAAVA